MFQDDDVNRGSHAGNAWRAMTLPAWGPSDVCLRAPGGLARALATWDCRRCRGSFLRQSHERNASRSAIARGTRSHHLLENPGKMEAVAEACLRRDLVDTLPPFTQYGRSLVYPQPKSVLMGRVPRRLDKFSDKSVGIHSRHMRESRIVDRRTFLTERLQRLRYPRVSQPTVPIFYRHGGQRCIHQRLHEKRGF